MRERQSRARARALAAGIVAGLALWCTRGGLEVVAGPAGPLRVALLPSGWQALSLIAAMAGAALGLAHAVAWAGGGDARAITDEDADVTRPLFASGVLVLPFLPWLADAWPALTILGGRFALLVWIVVGALTLRAAVLRIYAARKVHTTLFGPVAAVVALAGLLLYGGVAWRFAGSGLFPGGDEPHYLVLAQSLWRDHDLKIENNHARGDTLEYFRLPLPPHYLERGRDGEIYSIHPVGLAIVAAPIYAAGGYYGVVAFLVCCAAGAAAGLWLAALRLTGSATAATLAWVGAAATAPFVFNSITVYPEIPAAACAMAAYLIATRRGGIGQRPGLAAACGTLLALLPWLSSKYALMMAALAALALGRLWLPMTAEDVASEDTSDAATVVPFAQRIRVSLALGLPMVVSVALWMAFFDWIWGSPFPSVVYGTQRPVRWEYFVKGGPGLLFDQEYGIVPAAPIFAASLVGLIAMLWSDARSRRIAAEIVVIFAALLIPVGAFHLWSGGSGAIGRPVIAAILLLGLPIAWLARRTAASAVAAASLTLLAAASVAQMLFLLSRAEGAAAGRRPRRRVAPPRVLVAVLASVVAGAVVPDAAARDRVGLHGHLVDRARGRGTWRWPGCGGRSHRARPDWPRAVSPAARCCSCRCSSRPCWIAGARPRRCRASARRWRCSPSSTRSGGRSASSTIRCGACPRRRFRRCSPSWPGRARAASAPASICSTTLAGRCPPAATSSASMDTGAPSMARSACRSGASVRRCAPGRSRRRRAGPRRWICRRTRASSASAPRRSWPAPRPSCG